MKDISRIKDRIWLKNYSLSMYNNIKALWVHDDHPCVTLRSSEAKPQLTYVYITVAFQQQVTRPTTKQQNIALPSSLLTELNYNIKSWHFLYFFFKTDHLFHETEYILLVNNTGCSTSRYESDYFKGIVDNVTVCSSWCREVERCFAFTFNRNNNECRAIYECNGLIPEDGVGYYIRGKSSIFFSSICNLVLCGSKV